MLTVRIGPPRPTKFSSILGAVKRREREIRCGRLDYRDRDTGAVEHDPLLAGMRLRPLARRPAGRPLLARQHQLGELVGQFGAVAERELSERSPVRVALLRHHCSPSLSPSPSSALAISEHRPASPCRGSMVRLFTPYMLL